MVFCLKKWIETAKGNHFLPKSGVSRFPEMASQMSRKFVVTRWYETFEKLLRDTGKHHFEDGNSFLTRFYEISSNRTLFYWLGRIPNNKKVMKSGNGFQEQLSVAPVSGSLRKMRQVYTETDLANRKRNSLTFIKKLYTRLVIVRLSSLVWKFWKI